MGIETKRKAIGAHTYSVEQFGAKAGGRMLVRLAKMLGVAVGGAVEAGEKLDSAIIGRVLAGLTESIAEEDYDYLCNAFMAKTTVTGGQYGDKEPKLSEFFDSHFAGNYVELSQWLAFCLEANYGSFLSVIGEESKRLSTPLRVSDEKEEQSSTPSGSQVT